MKLLIEHKADVNKAVFAARTPLLAAVEEGRTDIVRILLDAGSAVDAADEVSLVLAVFLTFSVSEITRNKQATVHVT